MQSPFEVLIWPPSLSSKPTPSTQVFCPLSLALKMLKPWVQGGREACLQPEQWVLPLGLSSVAAALSLAGLPCQASVAVELGPVPYNPVLPATFTVKRLREQEKAVGAGENEEADNRFKFF